MVNFVILVTFIAVWTAGLILAPVSVQVPYNS